MGVGVGLAWYCRDDCIVMCQAGHLEICYAPKVRAAWVPDWSSTSIDSASRRQLLCLVVLGDDLQRLLEDLP